MPRRAPPFPEFLATSDFHSRHATDVRGSAAAAFSAIRHLDLRRSPLVRVLFRLRGLPTSAGSFDGLRRLGFVPLLEVPDRALVLGVAGRFWSPRGALQRLSPDAFQQFDRPGWAKAVWSFVIEPAGAGRVRLVTETHIRCFGTAARRRFGRYWVLVGPFSGLIRRECLRLVRQDVEHTAIPSAA